MHQQRTTCRKCGGQLPDVPYFQQGRSREYCSNACRQAAYRERQRRDADQQPTRRRRR